jgi:hypothetical protein
MPAKLSESPERMIVTALPFNMEDLIAEFNRRINIDLKSSCTE